MMVPQVRIFEQAGAFFVCLSWTRASRRYWPAESSLYLDVER